MGTVTLRPSALSHCHEAPMSLTIPPRQQQCDHRHPDECICARGRIVRILAVDDHEDSVRGLAKLLELQKFDVCIAFDGSSAIRTALAFRPDVVLLDMFMPDVSGIDVARLFRQLPNFDEVVLIAITGSRDAALHQQMQGVRIDHFLQKPCDFEQLLAILRPLCATRLSVESSCGRK